MVLTSPGLLLTPQPSSSPLKTPIRSYSAQTPPRNGNPTPPPPSGRGSRRRGRDTGDQNGPQADADALRHPHHSATALSPSADDTTANQTATSHRWCGRAGRESYDGNANDDKGSPRLHPPAPRKHPRVRTLFNHCPECVCVFITVVPITKLFAWGEGDSGGHVLRETTSRGLRGHRTLVNAGEGEIV